MSTDANSTTGKAIVWDHETHDYYLYLDGNFVGVARTYHEGEARLNALAYEILTHRARAGSVWSSRGTAE